MPKLKFEGNDIVRITWNCVEEEKIPVLRHNNEVIGACVTTGSSLKLYT